METALACKNTLEEYGIKVHITREKDVFYTLQKRSELANTSDAECFISIHYNATDNHKGKYGLIIGNKKDTSTKLTKCIKNELLNVRDNIQIWDNYGYYSVLNRTNLPSVIIETAFIDNVEDSKVADTLEKRQEIGKYIAYGIMDYLEVEKDKSKEEYTSRVDKTSNEIDNDTESSKEISKKEEVVNVVNRTDKSFLERVIKILHKNNKGSQDKMNYIKEILGFKK